MRNKIVKKAFAAGLSFATVFGMVPAISGTASVDAMAAPQVVNDINLNIDGNIHGIENPTSIDSSTTAWSGSKISYAGREWYVLDANGYLGGSSSSQGDMLLLSSKEVAHMTFDSESSDWSTSDIRNYLNVDFLAGFSSIEQGALVNTEISGSNTYAGEGTTFPSVTTYDKVFLLDLNDVQTNDYGFGSTSTLANYSYYWWLRSPENNLYVWEVDPGGTVSTFPAPWDSNELVRPAMNLDLDLVAFTTSQGTVKSDFALVGSNNVSADTVWQTTLINDDQSFDAVVPSYGQVTNEVTIDVTNIDSNSYNQVSAMLTDFDGNVVAYGKIGDSQPGQKTFTIPETIDEGDYELAIFGEQVNGSDTSDYVSNVVINDFHVDDGSNVGIAIASDSHVSLAANSAPTIQEYLFGPMEDIILNADSGYYFADIYSTEDQQITVDGVTLEKVSPSQVKISGTPTDDVFFDPIMAMEKLSQETPTDLEGGVEMIINSTTDMEYAATLDAEEWSACTEGLTFVDAGDWYVRYQETDTMKASDAVMVTATPYMDYEYTQGAKGEYTTGSGAAMKFVCKGPLKNLTDLFVDDMYVDKDAFTLESGSTIITFNADYISSLTAGEHTLDLAYTDGWASTTFTVLSAPVVTEEPEDKTPVVENLSNETKEETTVDTGDSTSVAGYMAMMTLSGSGALYLLKKKETL